MESCIYQLKNNSYKPDFIIYDENNEIKNIFEIKDVKLDDEDEKNEKYKEAIKYFKKLNIDYQILYNSQTIVKQYPEIKEKLIPLNFGISEKTVNKYFDNFENLKESLNNGKT